MDRRIGFLVPMVAAALVSTILGWQHAVPPFVAVAIDGLVAVSAIVLQVVARDPDRHSTRQHAWISIGYTATSIWSSAAGITLGIDAWAAGPARTNDELIKLLLLVAPNIGGFLALTRSIRTRSETGATLRELSTNRVATLSTPVIEESVRTFEARDVVELVQCVARMLRLTVSLPLARELLDEAVLWVRNDRDKIWFIMATSELARHDLSFTMPVVSEVEPQKGIVANLAVASPPEHPHCFFENDVFLCRTDLATHPWYASHPQSKANSMVAVLLRDRGEVIGVLSLATAKTDILPVSGLQRDELFDIMRFWSHSFLVPIRRLRDL